MFPWLLRTPPCGQAIECTLANWRRVCGWLCSRVLTGELGTVEWEMGLAPGDFQSEEGRALVDKYHAMFVAGLQQVRSQTCLHRCVHAEQVGLEAGAGG